MAKAQTRTSHGPEGKAFFLLHICPSLSLTQTPLCFAYTLSSLDDANDSGDEQMMEAEGMWGDHAITTSGNYAPSVASSTTNTPTSTPHVVPIAPLIALVLLLLLRLLPLSLRFSVNAIVGDQLENAGDDAAKSGQTKQGCPNLLARNISP